MRFRIGIIYATLLVLPVLAVAQPRFKGGIIAGLTASQIDGDNSAGYNKVGLQAGFRAAARFKKRTEGSIELLFAQRGSQSELVKDQYNPFNFSLTLNYIEVPVQFHYKDWLVEDGDKEYYRVSIGGGLSYARFMGSKFKGEPNGVSTVAPDFVRKNDLSFVIGADFFFNAHFGVTLRFVRGIGFMYNPRDWSNPPASKAWYGHCVYFQSSYMF